MKARLINHIQVGMLDIVGDCGSDLPDEEVDILCGPFVSTIGNSPMLAWYLCETEDGRRYYIEATNLKKVELPLKDWTKDVGKIFFIPVDWAAFRREAAKDILCSMVRGGYGWGREAEQARLAVSYAGELIKALKEEQK